ncbi:hypothetical protein BJ165DRAFT_1606346 [Panaeolus papilionaceus]|nr:hypothetical protein BJ165DRAFT_1606346 [Panaeolus papilionaceus]
MNVAYRAIRRPLGTRKPAQLIFKSHTQPVGLRWLASSQSNVAFDNVLHTLKHSEDAAALRTSYAELKHAIHSNTFTSLTPQKAHFENLLQVLTNSGAKDDALCVVDIVTQHLPSWHITLSIVDYAALCTNLLEQGLEKPAVELVVGLIQSSRNPFPSAGSLNEFIGNIDGGHVSFLQQLIARAVELGVECDSRTFELLFKAKWDAANKSQIVPTVEEWSQFIKSNIRHGALSHPRLVQVIEQGYLDLGLAEDAQRVVDVYDYISRDAECRSWLGQHGQSSADVEAVRKKFRIEPTPAHWTCVLRNLLTSDLEAGLKLYQEFLGLGNAPNGRLVQPLVQALWKAGGDPDEVLMKAIGLYRPLSEACPPSANVPHAPTLYLYLSLFRLFLRCPDTQTHQNLFRSVVDDMKSRGFATNISPIATFQIINEMQRTGSFSGALEVYRSLRQQLNESGFIYILKEYCRITFQGNLEVPLITQYFSIINDMRMQKLNIDRVVYTNILSSISQAARQIFRDSSNGDNNRIHERLIATTRRVHDFLTLDASISPDAALWNCLLDAYQRLGCFGDCYRVWEMMYLTGRYDNVTITIMLDACGYSGQLQQAQRILTKVMKDGKRLDIKNFNTWLECLCRNSKLRTAVFVACNDMPKLGVQPTVGTINLLAKFARKDGCWPDVSSKIEVALPKVWKEFCSSPYTNTSRHDA